MTGGAKAKLRGRWGEAYTAQYLRKKGFSIQASGYRSRFGEIDLIAADRQWVIFVEVKLRHAGSMVSGREAVDFRKQDRIRKTAQLWLAQHPDELRQPRFDVAEVIPTENKLGGTAEVIYLENAF